MWRVGPQEEMAAKRQKKDSTFEGVVAGRRASDSNHRTGGGIGIVASPGLGTTPSACTLEVIQDLPCFLASTCLRASLPHHAQEEEKQRILAQARC